MRTRWRPTPSIRLPPSRKTMPAPHICTHTPPTPPCSPPSDTTAGRRGDEGVAGRIAGGDLVITDLMEGWSLEGLAARVGQSAVVAVITPFGTTGPYVDEQVVANEFILQALCGSIAGRGWPGSGPLQAGGRIGEWPAETVAGGRAAAVVPRAPHAGGGRAVQ